MALLIPITGQGVSASFGSATHNLLQSRGFYTRFNKRDDGTLVYRSTAAYDNVIVHHIKRLGYQMASHYVDMAANVLETYTASALNVLRGRGIKAALKEIGSKQKEAAAESRRQYMEEYKRYSDAKSEAWKELINKGQIVDESLGTITTSDGHMVSAVDPYGRLVRESLFLWYTSSQELIVNEGEHQFTTKDVFVYDLTAEVSHSTSKNIVLTKVEGRDFTRKELVSGGDFEFSIKGTLNSNRPGVYPSNEVKKLIDICKYNGIIKVKHLLFSQFGVTQIIIKDYRLGAQSNLNEQPYTISCVAVEPDNWQGVSRDTITLINSAIASNSLDGWYETILNDKSNTVSSGYDMSDRDRRRLWLYNHI